MNNLDEKKPCKYCGFDGQMAMYVGFFKSEAIMEASRSDQRLPRYGFHLGIECPKCLKWQAWLPQTDEMLGVKFYLPEVNSSQPKLI